MTREYTINPVVQLLTKSGAPLSNHVSDAITVTDKAPSSDLAYDLDLSITVRGETLNVAVPVPGDVPDGADVNVEIPVRINPGELVEREVRRDERGRIVGMTDARYPTG